MKNSAAENALLPLFGRVPAFSTDNILVVFLIFSVMFHQMFFKSGSMQSKVITSAYPCRPPLTRDPVFQDADLIISVLLVTCIILPVDRLKNFIIELCSQRFTFLFLRHASDSAGVKVDPSPLLFRQSGIGRQPERRPRKAAWRPPSRGKTVSTAPAAICTVIPGRSFPGPLISTSHVFAHATAIF
jgi:hypothetical protein